MTCLSDGLLQCVDGVEVDMNNGNITAEMVEPMGALIAGVNESFVSLSHGDIAATIKKFV